jgi:ribosomal protein S18 acetylase RimI-like enzyme
MVNLLERFPTLEFPLSVDDLSRLPRNLAYRYQLAVDASKVLLSPEPALQNCVLDFPEWRAGWQETTVDVAGSLRPLHANDRTALQDLYHAAFVNTQPWSVLSSAAARELTRDCLEWMYAGGDGWLVPAACLGWFRNSAEIGGASQELLGAALVTLNPAGPLDDLTAPAWQESIPGDPLSVCWGRPHLHAVCVDPGWQRRGLATALLRGVLTSLLGLGYTELSSTVLIDNVPSLLWHWRAGFRTVGPVRKILVADQ